MLQWEGAIVEKPKHGSEDSKVHLINEENM